uniref:Putative secreted peptide n=1 Tax=Anopheles braziliensis TaxID=58242 RepID=A0A2M3ZX65_9DIPT
MGAWGWERCAQNKMCLRRLSWAFFLFFVVVFTTPGRPPTLQFGHFLQLFNHGSLLLPPPRCYPQHIAPSK